MTDDPAENKKYISAVLDSFSIPILHQEGLATQSQVWENTWMQRVSHGEPTWKEMPQKEV